MPSERRNISPLTDDDLAKLRDLAETVNDLPAPVVWAEWPTGETDWDEDENGEEIEVEETTWCFGSVAPAKSPFSNVMLFMIDPEGDISEENRHLIYMAVNALPLLIDRIDAAEGGDHAE